MGEREALSQGDPQSDIPAKNISPGDREELGARHMIGADNASSHKQKNSRLAY